MKPDDCIKEISKIVTPANALALWQRIRSGANLKPWDRGKALEYLILQAFKNEGAEIVWPYSVRDPSTNKELEQLDGAVFFESISALCESKDSKHKKNFEPIAKLKQQLARRPAFAVGAAFTRRDFTEEAMLLSVRAAPQNVVLWTPDDIELAIGKSKMKDGLKAKVRQLVTVASPIYDLGLENWP